MSESKSAKDYTPPPNFIRTIILDDIASGRYGGRVHTRFPPEPNGYLHIGHAKSICLNFGLANEFGGKCNLRFDDTNPEKENPEFVQSIQDDVRWLGFEWDDRMYFASDYFERLFDVGCLLIGKGLAYVDDQTAEQIRETRGTLTEPGTNSPYRDRSPEENLDLFKRMRAGEFPDGSRVLRAKIDMASPNIVLRDPVLYRIKRAHHHRTGDAWCIYPMYDFTHCLSDAFEDITHSICTLEFDNNRALYDWVLDNAGFEEPRPHQYEFARLNITYTMLSKRKLIQLVNEGVVAGWDDPRMPTLTGFRRRGYTPEAIRDFCERIGVSKSDNLVDFALLEHCLREDLNERAPRYMGVVDPIKVTIANYPEDQVEEFPFPNHPTDESAGKRMVPFCRELYIERDDFKEEAPRKWFRLAPGKEVRLRYAYYVTCTEVIYDEDGNVSELVCTYDPDTRGGWSEDGRKVKGTLHWVSARHGVPCEVRQYQQLFATENPAEGGEFMANLNPDSLAIVQGVIEPALAEIEPETNVQFERIGYYVADRRDHKPGAPVFNRTATLRDTWAKIAKKG
jgi:glutaminyl-tRNA synthetase